MLPPDTVDDVDASALVIEAEMATAIVNRARAMVQRRIAQLAEDGNAAEADRLRVTAAQPLFTLLRSIDYRNEAHFRPRSGDHRHLGTARDAMRRRCGTALDPPAGLRADG